MSEERQRASRWEILGAWLHLWTPPRDVEIPSPRRALIAAIVVVTAATVVVVTLVAPAIDRAKERDAARAERAEAQLRAALVKRLAAEQRAHHGRASAAARLWARGRREAALAALVVRVRRSVDRDARARVAAGDLKGPVLRVRCTPRKGDRGPRVHVTCLAVSADHVVEGVRRDLFGHPFVSGASLSSGRYAWCKYNTRPSEGAIGLSIEAEIPAECTA